MSTGTIGKSYFQERALGLSNSIEYAPPKGLGQGHGRSPPPISAREHLRKTHISVNFPSVQTRSTFRVGSAFTSGLEGGASMTHGGIIKEDLMPSTQTSGEYSRNEVSHSVFNF